MATAYKLITFAPTATATSQIAFTATAANTVVASIVASDAGGSANAEVLVKKNTGSIIELAFQSLTTTTPSEMLAAPVALEANDKIYVRTSRVGTNFIISYVEDTTTVSGQAIGVLSDVPSTRGTAGQVLAVNSGATALEYVDQSGGGALDDLSNVDTTGKVTNDVLLWDGSEWVESQRLSLVYELLKEGTSKTITAEPTNADTTEGFVKLEATNAKLKVNKTGVEISETSPGTVTFQVATDSSGTTEFDAAALAGSATANEAQFIMKFGTQLVCESSNAAQGRVIYDGTGNSLLKLPTSSGQIALTSQLYTDADADGQIASASVTDLTDVTSAGSGAIITSVERTKLSGIATGAEVNAVDSVNTQTGAVVLDTDDISEGSSNLYYTEARVSANSSVAANTAKNSYPSADATKLAGIETGADVTDATNVALAGAIMDSDFTVNGIMKRTASGTYGVVELYEEDELIEDYNVKMNTSVSVASNRVVDIMGDALADTSNANTKKFLGFHNGSGVCVLKGMVDAGNSIAGASAGSPLWLGASGAFSATAPTTATYYSRVVGYYVGNGQGGEVLVYFDPSRDWVQID